MGKNFISFSVGRAQGRCLSCQQKFVGPGDRCQKCQHELRQGRRRKPR